MTMPYQGNRLFLLVWLLCIAGFTVMAQDSPRESVFFCAPHADVSLNNEKDGPSFGGGFTVGFDGRVGGGISCIYLHEISMSTYEKRIDALEATIFLRVYLLKHPCRGLFTQLNVGPILYFEEDEWSIPAKSGTASASLALGWRIPLGNYVYIEPLVRGGYPFLVNASLAIGFRY